MQLPCVPQLQLLSQSALSWIQGEGLQLRLCRGCGERSRMINSPSGNLFLKLLSQLSSSSSSSWQQQGGGLGAVHPSLCSHRVSLGAQHPTECQDQPPWAGLGILSLKKSKMGKNWGHPRICRYGGSLGAGRGRQEQDVGIPFQSAGWWDPVAGCRMMGMGLLLLLTSLSSS